MKQFLIKNRYLLIAIAAFSLIVTILVIQLTTSGGNTSTDNTTPTDATNTNNTPDSATDSPTTSATVANIVNYSEVVRNLPATETSLIYQVIAGTLQMNGVSGVVDDITIRDGSYSQIIIDNAKMIYQTRFIIDIPSIQQSYVVQDKYSPLPPEETNLYDYTTLVLCPDESEKIYPQPNCTDRIKFEETGK